MFSFFFPSSSSSSSTTQSLEQQLTEEFNQTLIDFLTEIITIFPHYSEVRQTKLFLSLTMKAKASLVMQIWYIHITQPYGQHIAKGDLCFFLEKDYRMDIAALDNADQCLEAIEKLREPLKQMSPHDQQCSIEYLQKLNALACECFENI